MDFHPNRNFEKEWAHSPECLDVLLDATGKVHDVFNSIAPRRTGRMVENTHIVANTTPGGWETELVVNVHYAKFVEAGTRYMRAQWNLRRALEIVESETT